MSRCHILLLLPLAGCAMRAVPAGDGGANGQTADGQTADGGSSTVCAITWTCTTSADGQRLCRSQPGGGLPTAHDSWSCQPGFLSWICHGGETLAAPPSACGWTCRRALGFGGVAAYRCERDETGDDVPGGVVLIGCRLVQGGECWVCARSSAVGGTLCARLEPWQSDTLPKVGGPCLPGQRAWCHSLQFDGWGLTECDPKTRTWKTELVNSVAQNRCTPTADGRGPDTLCACYLPYPNFNLTRFDCCERVDCVVPPGTSGRVCPATPGRACDYCQPAQPSCAAPGSRCVTPGFETFCADSCVTQSCPAGFDCLTMKDNTQLCIPTDLSCLD